MKLFLLSISIILFYSCAHVKLEPSDFAWPIESVIDVDDEGFIQEPRYSFNTNVKQLYFVETGDSNNFVNETVRIIRGTKGYYYFIAAGFKNVYIFNATNGNFELENKFQVSEFGLDLPAFNQRNPFIELLEGENHITFLKSDGLKEKK